MNEQQKFQRIRMQRIGFACLTYFFVLICTYIIQWSGIDYLPVEIWVAVIFIAILGNIVFYILIVTDINLRFEDPSMTKAQILYSAIWGLLCVIYLVEARTLVLMLYLAAFMFGALKLSRKEYLEVVFYISSFLALGLAYEFAYLRPNMNILFEGLRWLCFTFILIWLAIFGSYMYETKRKLRKTCQRLEDVQSELKDTSKKLETAADTDYLTGIMNRRAFYKNLPIQPSRRQQIYTILLQDIDLFKSVNDKYGHDIGDLVLIDAVKRIQAVLRTEDLLVRWGGEEFLIFLVGLNKIEAIEVAERLRRKFEENPIVVGSLTINITLSQGMVQFNHLKNISTHINNADKLMYQAKQKGRNCLQIED